MNAKYSVLGFVTNLGTGECYISMPCALPVETKVSVALWLDEQRKIWVDEMIVSSHHQIGLGVKFLNVTGQVVEAIKGTWNYFHTLK